MLIDIITIVILGIAIFKGFSRGLVVGVFTFLSLFIGLAAAIKLSSVVAYHLGRSMTVSERWLPVLAFAVVFIGVVLLVRLLARIIEKTLQLAMLGLLNRIGGILFYACLYILAFSVVLFYADQLPVLTQRSKEASVSYEYLAPLGPRVIDAFGKIWPVFSNMFEDLKEFFGTVSRK